MPGTKEREFQAPHHEAAMFYGLFLRGHPVALLRQQIDIPPTVFRKLMRHREYDPDFREHLRRTYRYRKQVLTIFNSLVTSAQTQSACQ